MKYKFTFVYIPKSNVECYQPLLNMQVINVWKGVQNNIQKTPFVETFKYTYKET